MADGCDGRAFATSIRDVVNGLDEAMAALEADDLDAAEGSLARLGSKGGAVRQALRLVVDARRLEAAGDEAGSAKLHEAAYDLHVTVPAVLHPLGRHFLSTGAHDRAYVCYSLLDAMRPGSFDEFLKGLPPPLRFAYAPAKIKSVDDAGIPAPYEIQAWKASLSERLGPEGAAVTLAATSHAGVPPSVTACPLRPLDEYLREHALPFRELSGTRTVRVRPPLMVTGHRPPARPRVTRSFFATVLGDGVVAGKSDFIVCGSEALLDVTRQELKEVPVRLDVDPMVLAATDDTVLMPSLSPDGMRAVASAMPLVGLHTHAFGDWMLQFLPRLLAWLPDPSFAAIPILVDRVMPPQHRQAVEMFAGASRQIVTLDVGERVLVHRLWTASMPVHIPSGVIHGGKYLSDGLAVDAETFAGVYTDAFARAGRAVPQVGPRLLYLARGAASQWRHLGNQLQVEAWFEERGFTIVAPETLTFAEQLGAIRAADVIIGPDGSALLLTLFARRGARVGYLTPGVPVDDDGHLTPIQNGDWYAEVSRVLGHRVVVLPCPTTHRRSDLPGRSDYSVDLDQLPEFLSMVMG